MSIRDWWGAVGIIVVCLAVAAWTIRKAEAAERRFWAQDNDSDAGVGDA
jgi:hypothetical protein